MNCECNPEVPFHVHKKGRKKMPKEVECPECETVLFENDTELDMDDSISCDECGSEYVVTGLNPVELTPVSYEEDAEEDEEDEDED
jgi:alpha-aminoadipate/glutamate carrier protein LysW